MVDFVNSWVKWITTDPYLKIYTTNTSQDPVRNLYHWFPSTKKFFFSYETEWKSGPATTQFAREHLVFPVVCCALYVVIIFGLKFYLRNRAPFEIRVPQMYWNLFLAVFSICGALRMVPYALAFVWNEGTLATVCTNPVAGFGGQGPSGLWTCLFIYSKVPELVDTLFIVLGKRPLIFLHWYHHITVLLFCWLSYAERASVGLSFAAMNYFVHAVMYTYYFFQNKSSLDLGRAKKITDETRKSKAMRSAESVKKVLSSVAPVITGLQISQMVVGVWVMYVAYPLISGPVTKCHTTRNVWLWGTIMYLSYFILFVVFALERYICPSSTKVKPE